MAFHHHQAAAVAVPMAAVVGRYAMGAWMAWVGHGRRGHSMGALADHRTTVLAPVVKEETTTQVEECGARGPVFSPPRRHPPALSSFFPSTDAIPADPPSMKVGVASGGIRIPKDGRIVLPPPESS